MGRMPNWKIFCGSVVEKLMVHFLKRGRKLMNAGVLKPERAELFKELLALVEENKRKNQYV